jgi:hypothetical protein
LLFGTDAVCPENDAIASEEAFGCYDAECVGCDIFGRVGYSGLCEECSGKLERDLIRKRDWDYSSAAYGVPEERREELRRRVIKQYGKDLELISPDAATAKTTSGTSSRKKKKNTKTQRRKRHSAAGRPALNRPHHSAPGALSRLRRSPPDAMALVAFQHVRRVTGI